MTAHDDTQAQTADLLFEIGTEELPPKPLRNLSYALYHGVTKGLAGHSLAFEEHQKQIFATPRRLSFIIQDLALMQPDAVVERRGPPLSRAFDDAGNPTKAATGFAQSCGVAVEQLERLENDQGTWLVFRRQQPGRPARELLPEIIRHALAQLPIPKRMRWNAMETQFVRPVHWAVLLLGDELIECDILGVATGRETRGHRFHRPEPLSLNRPGDYAAALRDQGHVIPEFDHRREIIRERVKSAADSVKGHAVIDEDLLEEVTALVEWPVAVLGSFDERFLEIPREAVISSMQDHQKSFAVVDGGNKLMPYFIAVSNIDSSNPGSVRAGFERVIRPRLADADFFWTQDRRQPLANRLEQLEAVVFQQRLGTLADKCRRLTKLIEPLAAATGADTQHARRGALLCKCDLMTRMVEEFPELQGIMGRYYAAHDGEPQEVARAVEEHYWPRFAGDALPQSPAGRALALADKLDTLVGVFAIGQAPTGDKDPFALRRAALGVLRILIEGGIDIDLDHAVTRAAHIYNDQDAGLVKEDVHEQVFDFIMNRLHVYYINQGFAHDTINAVLALRPTYLTDIDRRLRALAVFRDLPAAESLAAANKRIGNILRKADAAVPEKIDAGLFKDEQEQALFDRLQALGTEVDPLIKDRDYEAALKQLAGLRQPVDAFFDHVMVMTDDAALRDNRLALLNRLKGLFARIADLSALQ